MVQRLLRRSATRKGVPTMLRKEEYVGDMVPMILVPFAATRGVLIGHKEEEFVSGMVHH